jgi:predicted nuclease of predicted toxin-antitoxin system/Uma2 family endonuclease
MIAILLDQGIAPRAATIFRERGSDAVHVIEIGMAEADDFQILEMARTQDQICVTLDHDFHTHLALAGYGRPSVILLRVESLGAQAQAELIASICLECETACRREPQSQPMRTYKAFALEITELQPDPVASFLPTGRRVANTITIRLMSTVLVSLEEYLNTAYSPDREYVDGEVVVRNVGERPHSLVQSNLIFCFPRDYPDLFVWPERRVRTVPGRRRRVLDVCVTLEDPGIDVFEAPPLICIEILSKKDRRSRIVAKCEEYAAFGVPHILVLDPRGKRAWRYENSGLEEIRTDALAAGAHGICLPFNEVFRGL